MTENPQKIVILGAGIAGLSTAWKLLRENPDLQVTLIERDSLPGGLAKSIHWNGYVLDLGPHRFHTELVEIRDFIKTFCEERMICVKRASRMFLNGRYIPYPIKALPTFQALGLSNTISFVMSALGVLWQEKTDAKSYEDYVIGYYGEKLYRTIFQPFAEKVWGIPANRITAETARVRLRGENIWHSLKDSLFSRQETYVAQFLYPMGGIGEISQKFAQEVIQLGGDIRIDQTVTRINFDGSRIRDVECTGPNGSLCFPCDMLVNTIPLTQLPFLMNPLSSEEVRASASLLRYRAITLLYLQLDEELNIDDTWLYYPEKRVPFSRIYVPDNFAPHKKQPGKTCLCLEFPCEVDSELWRMSAEELSSIAEPILRSSGLTHSSCSDSLVVRIKEGYPLYEIGYEQNVKTVLDYLSSLENCLTTGRQGLFRHNNLDQSLQMGLLAAEPILQDHPIIQWYENIERFNDYRIID